MIQAESDRSTHQQESELAIILMLARHCENRTFIDVGAEKGVFAETLMAAGFDGALFEPFPAHHEGLAALVQGTGSKVYPYAIDATDHEGALHIAHDMNGRTMDYFHSLHRDEQNPIAHHDEALPVTCRSLASLWKEGLLSHPTGILKIDTEGTDLHVMRGLGDLRAEVLICEFVTPRLYPSWNASFPEALIQEARALGYEECIAVKRFSNGEVISLGEPIITDGQWGNLIFTSRRLLLKILPELISLAQVQEAKLVDIADGNLRIMQEKEAYIQRAARSMEEKQAAIHDLVRDIDALKTRISGYQTEIARQKAKNAELREKLERRR